METRPDPIGQKFPFTSSKSRHIVKWRSSSTLFGGQATSESAERPSSKAKPAPALEATAEDGGGGGGGSSSELCVCDICGKTLKHQKSLYSHRRTHTDSKAVCHICGATLKSARYLHHHLLLHKNVEKPHKCDKCGKAFFSSSALKGARLPMVFEISMTVGAFQTWPRGHFL